MNQETEFDPSVDARADQQSAQVIQIDSSKHVNAITVCAVISGMSVILAVVGAVVAWNASTDYRVELNHTVQLEARLGIVESRVKELEHEQRR